MSNLRNMLSIYIVIVMLGIGAYMGLLQAKTLKTVNHLDREATFSRIVGWIYIIAAIVVAVFIAVY